MKRFIALVLTFVAAQAGASGLVYVGTQAGEIRALRFDPVAARLSAIGTVAKEGAPTWVAAHPRLPILYAVDDDKTRDGSASAWAVDRVSGALVKMGQAPAGGSGTNYLALDPKATTLFAANFGSGSASSIALSPDGIPGPLVSTIKASGSGPHRRQASPHAHSVTLDPSGRYALVPDLGADRVFVYAFDAGKHTLAPIDAAAFALPPGSGPRHLVFGKDGRHAYLMNELTAELNVLRWDAGEGRLAPIQALPLSSAGFAGSKSGSALALSADGRFLYAANRGEHELQVLRIDPASGALALMQRIASGGQVPWGFALHPLGRWLAVAHQRSNSVNLFAVDPATGTLANTGQSVDIPAPVSITFLP